MDTYYADTSVLIKRHVRENGSTWVQAIADSADNVIVSTTISMIEVCSGFNRRCREENIDVAGYQQLMTDFDYLCEHEYEWVEFTREVIERAQVVLAKHPLRAYDAVQLASALLLHESLQKRNIPLSAFLSSDKRLLDAARAEGLHTIDPNEQI